MHGKLLRKTDFFSFLKEWPCIALLIQTEFYRLKSDHLCGIKASFARTPSTISQIDANKPLARAPADTPHCPQGSHLEDELRRLLCKFWYLEQRTNVKPKNSLYLSGQGGMLGQPPIQLLAWEYVLADTGEEESRGQWERPRPHTTLQSFQDSCAL